MRTSEFQKLSATAYAVIDNFVDNPRKYYFCNIMKLVKTYGPNESFGELALITNKRRKAKLVTSTDTHFAILSKVDYREA